MTEHDYDKEEGQEKQKIIIPDADPVESKEPKPIPFRKIEVFQSDDNRRIEVMTLAGKVVAAQDQVKDDEDDAEEEEREKLQEERQKLFIGVMHIVVEEQQPIFEPDGVKIVAKPVPKEIKFQIRNVSTIEEAFNAYLVEAEQAFNSIMERQKEAQKKANEEERTKIVTPPPGTMNAIDQATHGPNRIIG